MKNNTKLGVALAILGILAGLLTFYLRWIRVFRVENGVI